MCVEYYAGFSKNHHLTKDCLTFTVITSFAHACTYVVYVCTQGGYNRHRDVGGFRQ